MTNTTAPRRWAILASFLIGLIGLQWWLVPATYPALGRLGSDSAAALAGLLGAAGTVTGWALGRPLGPTGRWLATTGAGFQAVALGFVASDSDLAAADAGPLYVVGAIATGALWVALAARAGHDVPERPDTTLAGVRRVEGGADAEGLRAPVPRGRAARPAADRSAARARLRARGRHVAGV